LTDQTRGGDEVAARKVEAPSEGTAQQPATGDAGAGGEAREAHGRELASEGRAEGAETDTRRAQEKAAEAEQATKDAQEAEEEARKKEQEARDREERVQQETESAREQAADAGGTTIGAPRGARATSAEPIVFGPFTAEKPELLVGAAFAGAFVLARVLKAITTD